MAEGAEAKKDGAEMKEVGQGEGKGEGDEGISEKFVLTSESRELEMELLECLKGEDKTTTQKKACVQFFINQIFKIDDVEQSVELDFYLKVNWIDEQFKGVSDDDFQENEEKEFWKPGVEVVNGIDIDKKVEEDEAYWIEYPEHGILAYTQRYIGSLSTMMHLRHFPFDFQTLNITFESFHWKASDLKLVPLKRQQAQIPPPMSLYDDNGDRIYHWPGMADKVDLPGWDITMIHAKSFENYYRFEDRYYWQIVVNLHITRKSEYYVKQIILLLAVIFILSLTVCFMDPSDVGSRVGFTITLFLALVAYHFVISTSLPKVSYETALSRYLFMTYALVGCTQLQNVLVFMIYNYDPHGNYQLSESREQFWVAKIIDWVMLVALTILFGFANYAFFRGARDIKKRAKDFRLADLRPQEEKQRAKTK